MPLNLRNEYLASLRAMGRKPATLKIYAYALTQCEKWRREPIEDITRLEARAFLRYLTETYKPSGVDSRLKALRAYFNWLVVEEERDDNPFRGLTIKIPDDPQLTASAEQIEAMLTRATVGRNRRRDSALLTVLVDTGCRKGEAAALTRDDIDLNSGTITFRESKSRPRTVPMTDRAVIAISRWLRQRGVGGGSLWSVTDPYSLVRQTVKKHSRGELSPHSLRRAFAVRWLADCGSEVGLMRVCGWNSREMIARYTRDSADVLAHNEFRKLMAS